jgi:outer membrane protein TolC
MPKLRLRAGGLGPLVAAGLAVVAVSSTAWAQSPAGRTLTLDDALRLADERSQQIVVAQAAVDRAESGLQRVRSAMKPQLTGAASYDRTLDSEFRGVFDSFATGPTCDPLKVNALAPLTDRIAELERAYNCPPQSNVFGGGANDLPFGQDNAFRLNLQFSRALYTGGRVQAQEREATLGKQTASIGLTITRAQLALDVSQAFYDAALSDRLVAIAEEVLAQADRTLEQTRAQRAVGRVSEFDLLRAQVSRDTLQPQVILSRVNRDIAYLRVKQILELPLTTPITLVANLEDARVSPAERLSARLALAEASTGAPPNRTATALAATDVLFREAAIDLVKAQRKPNVSLTSAYGRVGYSGYPSLPRTNWTVGASVSMPILTGGRIAAEEASARADLTESQARQKLTEQSAVLEAEGARLQVSAALAAWEATGGTIEQAQRAYGIAEIRYQEGISTQLELSDARLLLQQAQVNRAQAARNVQLARVRLALLSELPLSGAR